MSLLFALMGSIALADSREEWADHFNAEIKPIFEKKCVECHGRHEENYGLNLAEINTREEVLKLHDRWDEITKRIRLVEMPPEGANGFSDEERHHVLGWLDRRPVDKPCDRLATDETTSWYRGAVMSRRLTRAEYNNCVRDLFGVDIKPADQFPADGSGGEGFDTTGDTLFTTATHVEHYLRAAAQIAHHVLPDDDQNLSPDLKDARERLMKVTPSEEIPVHEASRETLKAFLPRVFRRPVAHDEVDRYLRLFENYMQKDGSYISALRKTIMATLISPHFLFVVETDTSGEGVQRLAPYQLATRLSLFLWSSMPDEKLFECAANGSILEHDVFRAQVRRMVKDPKARALGENFGVQWLGIGSIGTSHIPDQHLYPQYTPQLATAMREEVVLYIQHLFSENRPVTDLIQSDYTFVNSELAQLYGISDVTHDDMQKVMISDSHRGGVVTMASVLMVSSFHNRTSPVLRGRWILDELMGSKVPPPPPNVPSLEENSHAVNAVTLREKLELHRSKPECAACHSRMDPLGFGLEHFDAIGAYRELDNGHSIDDSGVLPDGQKFNGPAELKAILMSRKPEFSRNFVKKLLGYALGRELNMFDECVVNECLTQLQIREDRAEVLLETIAISYPFQHRYYKK
jgi:hypothetical protein